MAREAHGSSSEFVPLETIAQNSKIKRTTDPATDRLLRRRRRRRYPEMAVRRHSQAVAGVSMSGECLLFVVS